MIPDVQLAWHLGALVAALLSTGIIQLLTVRLSRGNIGVVGSLFIGFAAGFFVLLAAEIFCGLRWPEQLADSIALGIANFVLFVCCWYFYFHFINIGEASLRIRVLREAERFSGQPVERLLEIYNVRTVVETRMKRLVEDGQLIVVAERFHAGKPRMVMVAKAFAFLRWLLLGRSAK